MSHLHRFYAPSLEAGAARLALPPDEAHHAAQVARVRAGDEAELFDGLGTVAQARVLEVTRRDVVLSVESWEQMPLPAPGLTLAVAWLHRDKAIEHVIVHGTEVGVRRFVFFRSAHSQKAPKENPKWTRWAVEACKQCGRAWLPEFELRSGIDDVLAEGWGRPVVAAMEGPHEPLRGVAENGDVVLFIGPEGDFTVEELALLGGCGAAPISLGETTFRSEVAGVLAATLFAHAWGRLGV
ncbi:MAG: 16S rRNA (uracil(1498)-N(3))-methyltransferase [Candidatus Hydrogenedentes bacterium]|nr:16S rRNA (uracil(1498)-N(3))-methyltransferase [Candidatus Hydrogenedentota bacterium]